MDDKVIRKVKISYHGYRKDGQIMQNDALEQIRKVESDHQSRIQAMTEHAADQLRQAAGDKEVKLREKEAALRRDLLAVCEETEKKAASIRNKAAADAAAQAKSVRISAEERMDAAVSYVVDAILSCGTKTS